ncbi:hypothetical protein F2Q70_00025888 [Brassica cretica]|uniref:Uncharacterized protein n=1 Tax=Brassica cretica TaxID=69181 RepID=A0A8S9LG12_BRACR|nr:hypothetical protein F2Q70_00025888 [Brassica cretica]
MSMIISVDSIFTLLLPVESPSAITTSRNHLVAHSLLSNNDFPSLSRPAGFVFAREKLRVGVFQPVTAAREGGGFSHLLLRFQYRTVWSAAGEWQVEAMRALPELLVCVGSCGFGSWLWWCCGVGVNLASRSSGCSWGLYYATGTSFDSTSIPPFSPRRWAWSSVRFHLAAVVPYPLSCFYILGLEWLNRHVAYPGAVSNLLMVMLPLKLLQVMEHCSVSFSSSCPVSAFLFLRCRIRGPFGLFVCGRFSVVEAVQPVIEQFSKLALTVAGAVPAHIAEFLSFQNEMARCGAEETANPTHGVPPRPEVPVEALTPEQSGVKKSIERIIPLPFIQKEKPNLWVPGSGSQLPGSRSKVPTTLLPLFLAMYPDIPLRKTRPRGKQGQMS